MTEVDADGEVEGEWVSASEAETPVDDTELKAATIALRDATLAYRKALNAYSAAVAPLAPDEHLVAAEPK